MFNRLQETSHFCRISLLLFLLITDEVDSAFHRRCFSLTEYYLCLSTDTLLSLNWNDARTWCASNNSALIDVSSSEVQSTLDTFRNDSSSQLRTLGNWIDVTYNGLTDWHWIDGAPSNKSLVSGSQSNGELFATISLFSNQASFSAHTYDKNLRYICQFDADYNCSGGFIRDSKCYLKYFDTSSWFGASNSCLATKGKLATFNGLYTPSNDTGMTSWLQLNGTDAYWIGLIRTTFKRSNGNEVQYTKWAGGHPHFTPPASPKPCILYGNDGWQDSFDCSATQRFVCQENSNSNTPETVTVSSTTSNSLLDAPSSSKTTTTTSATTSTLSSSPSAGGSSEVSIIVRVIVGVVVGVGGAIIVAVIVIIVLCFVSRRKRAQNGNENFTSIAYTDNLSESKKHPENKNIMNNNDLTGVYATMAQHNVSKGHNDRDSRSIDFISNEPVIYAELDSNSASRS